MGSAPSLGAPTWEGQTPTDQPPLQSSNPPINYTGSYGQPSNNFQGMGKSPQASQPQGLASNPMAQGAPMQQPQQAPMQPQQDPRARLQGIMQGWGDRSIDGAVSPQDIYKYHTGRM